MEQLQQLESSKSPGADGTQPSVPKEIKVWSSRDIDKDLQYIIKTSNCSWKFGSHLYGV